MQSLPARGHENGTTTGVFESFVQQKDQARCHPLTHPPVVHTACRMTPVFHPVPHSSQSSPFPGQDTLSSTYQTASLRLQAAIKKDHSGLQT